MKLFGFLATVVAVCSISVTATDRTNLRSSSSSGGISTKRDLEHHGGGHAPPPEQPRPAPPPRPAPQQHHMQQHTPQHNQHGGSYPEPAYGYPNYPKEMPRPTPFPTPRPTYHPTSRPTDRPTPNPTRLTTRPPTPDPTARPTNRPTASPTRRPTATPTARPTNRPTSSPTRRPTATPTARPSASPSISQTPTTSRPSHTPSENPTQSEEPSENPTQSEEPSNNPTQSEEPSDFPTQSEEPSEFPTQSEEPSEFPTQSEEPSDQPTFFLGEEDIAQIICDPANDAIFGILCDALRATGLLPLFEQYGRGNRGDYIPPAAQTVIDRYGGANRNYYIPAAAQEVIDQYAGRNRNNIPTAAQVIIDRYGPNRRLQQGRNLQEEQELEKEAGRDLQGFVTRSNLFTVFAPNNQAFTNLFLREIDALFAAPQTEFVTSYFDTQREFIYNRLSDRSIRSYFYSDLGLFLLREVLLTHVIGREISSQELICNNIYTMINGEPTVTECDRNNNRNGKFQIGEGNLRDGGQLLPRIGFSDIVASNGVIHEINQVILPLFDPFIIINTPSPSSPTAPTPAPVLTPATCMCRNTDCLGGLRMTYNRQRCDPRTTQRTNELESNYCRDLQPGALPTGTDAAERLGYELRYCNGRDRPPPLNLPNTPNDVIGYRNPIFDEVSFDLNVRNEQAPSGNAGGFLGVCLPQCIQVRLFSYAEATAVPANNVYLQTFNIDTRCAGNSLVSRTNYGAFYYRQDFNTMCPIGKK